jgi:hypothetical protein
MFRGAKSQPSSEISRIWLKHLGLALDLPIGARDCAELSIVNRVDLQTAAKREGIKDSAYSLKGGMPDECYVLAIVEGGWTVYYSERGKRNDETFFETEDEACSFLLLRLVGDPTTRRR